MGFGLAKEMFKYFRKGIKRFLADFRKMVFVSSESWIYYSSS
jgi:hypothetical protein